MNAWLDETPDSLRYGNHRLLRGIGWGCAIEVAALFAVIAFVELCLAYGWLA